MGIYPYLLLARMRHGQFGGIYFIKNLGKLLLKSK